MRSAQGIEKVNSVEKNQLCFLTYFGFAALVGVSNKNKEDYTLRQCTRTRNYKAVISFTDFIITL